jgi:hypothetical protein
LIPEAKGTSHTIKASQIFLMLLFVSRKADRSQTTNQQDKMPPKVASASPSHNLTAKEVDMLAALATLMGEVPSVSFSSFFYPSRKRIPRR